MKCIDAVGHLKVTGNHML